MNTIWGSLSGNIIGTLYFLYFQACGILLAWMLLSKKDLATRILCGSVLGSVLLSWLPALFAFLFDFSVTAHICAAMLCGIGILVVYFLKRPVPCFSLPSFSEIKQFVKRHQLFLFLFLFTFVIFSLMLSSHSFPLREDGMHTGQCTYGDMNMHLGFITSIARQQTFPPDYSISPGTRLCWPFLCDSISSSVYLWRTSLRWAYMLPIYFAILQVMAGFYCLAYSWLKKASHACLAWFLFFYNGGLGFVYFIDWANERTYEFKNIFTEFYQTPTNLINNNIRWVNIIVDMLLPQRATLFGYAVLFTCIWLLWRCVYNHEKDLFPFTALLTASLPMIHTHSFLAMGLVSAAWLLMDLFRKIKLKPAFKYPGKILLAAFLVFMCLLQFFTRKGEIVHSSDYVTICLTALSLLTIIGIWCLVKYIHLHGLKELLSGWGIYLVIILILALPQLFYWTFNQASNSGFNTGLFNWGNQGDQYLWFYIKNWGVILLLLIPAICYSSRKDLGILSASFLIWFVVELISISPNPYDNNKLLYVTYMFFCCASAKYGCDLYRRIKPVHGITIWSAFFVFLACISALLSMGRELVSDYTLYSASHVKAAEYIDENTPADATFLTNERHVNEIASLTGRNIVSGASVFLGPHGIYDTERASDVRAMYENPMASQELFQKYHVDYVMISSWERGDYAVDETAFDTMFPCVFNYNNNEIKLYKTNPLN